MGFGAAGAASDGAAQQHAVGSAQQAAGWQMAAGFVAKREARPATLRHKQRRMANAPRIIVMQNLGGAGVLSRGRLCGGGRDGWGWGGCGVRGPWGAEKEGKVAGGEQALFGGEVGLVGFCENPFAEGGEEFEGLARGGR